MKKVTVFLFLVSLILISCQNTDQETGTNDFLSDLQGTLDNKGDNYAEAGITHYKDAEYELAKQELKKALNEDLKEYPRNLLLTILGNVYNEQYLFDSSIFFHKKSLELDSSFVTTWVNLGISYRQNAQYDSAEYCYIKANEINPTDPELHASLGALYIVKGNPKNAIIHLEKAIELNPNLAISHSNYAIALAMNNKFKEANKEARLAVALGYKNGKALKERIQHIKELEE